MSILKQVMEEKLSETPINGTGTVPKITVITSQFDKNSREIYEIGAQYSVASFERYMYMLKSIYTNQSVALPKSFRMYELRGLNLLLLLSQNRLGNFHTESSRMYELQGLNLLFDLAAKHAVDHLDTIADNFEIDMSDEKELESTLDMMMNHYDDGKGKQNTVEISKFFCHSDLRSL